MTTQKEIIILGDVEMGGGTLTDDFISDKALSELISEISKKSHPVDLVFNGDTFDFLKCPSIIAGKKSFPRHVTEEISLNKLGLIYQAHQQVFITLQKFLQKKENNVYFVLGNHDHDLVYKSVQIEIKRLLQSQKQVHFPGFNYQYSRVYVEHGHQYDFLNKVNPKHSFLNYKGERILNIPWVSFSLISRFMEMKETHPFMERIFPRPTLFAHHKNLFKKITHWTVEYMVKSIVYYPFRYHYDPTYTYPKEILREFYRRYKDVHWDVDKIVDKFKRKKKRTFNKHQIHVLGHVHDKYLEENMGKVLIHPGSWRDEYELDVKTKKLTPKTKGYVTILVSEDGSLDWKIINHPMTRSSLHLDDVMKDEKKYIHFAAKEENFKFKIF
ncbi:MAG: metallophosphoesterase [Nanoarchaeota archaeon]|nr:metallophosphoesterase [Nanoarchaeota archaeon]MBU1632611.1 metallophosphoesterase [Nanoarchaeota archaeon]MBU1876371.1 metallophosphoesterase [Nanoarchaeota archaeon]